MLSRLRSLARRLVVLLAWLVLVGAVGLLALEESGVLVDLLRLRLAWRLGPLGQGLSIEHVSLRWFEPGIVVEGVTLLGPERDGVQREILRLRSVHVALRPDADLSRPLRRLHVEGGRVRISDDLLGGFDRIVSSFSGGRPMTAVGRRLQPPRMLLTDVDVELELPDRQTLTLGRLDLAVDPRATGGFDVRGQVLPTLAGAVPRRVPVLIDGHLGTSDLALHASARDLAIETARAVLPPILADLPIGDFAGGVTLDGEARLAWGGGAVEARGELRAAVAGTRWVPWPGFPALEEPEVDVEIDFHPAPGGGLWERASWSSRSRARARWSDARAEAWCLLGDAAPGDSLLRGWARIGGLRLDPSTRDALLPWVPVAAVWEAYGPAGRADLALDLEVPWSPAPGAEAVDGGTAGDGAGAGAAPGAHGTPGAPGAAVRGAGVPAWGEVAAWIRPAEGASVTYHGWPLPADRRVGLPIPCQDLRGDLLLSLSTARGGTWRLGLADLRGAAGGAVVRLDGVLAGRLGAPRAEPLDLDALVTIEGMPLGPLLRDGLAGNVATRDIWPHFAPDGGFADATWRLHEGVDVGGFTAEGEVRVTGTRVTWHELPVPVANVSGVLGFRWGARTRRVPGPDPPRLTRDFGLRLDLASAREVGSSEPEVAVRGLFRDDHGDAAALRPEDLLRPGLEELRVEVRGMPLRGRDWETVVARFPEVRQQAEELGAKGFADVVYSGSRGRPAEPRRSSLEIVPGIVELTPAAFPRRTRDLRGRLLVRSEEGPAETGDATEVELALAGAWPGDVVVAARGRLRLGGPQPLDVAVAGIDPTDSAFQGALSLALSASGMGSPEGGGLSEDFLLGRLDFRLGFDLALPPEHPERTALELFLRDGALVTENLRLLGLNGRLVRAGEVLESELVHARLADHPIELRDVRLFRAGDASRVAEVDPVVGREGFVDDPEALVLQAELHVRDLPLDEEHLSGLVDEDTLRGLEESLAWRGEIDVPGARLVVANARDGSSHLAVRGLLRPQRITTRLGLPIEIRTAEVDLRELIWEAGRIRGWASLEGLEAEVAGRELRGASMILSYVDGRLTIDDLSGDFEGGRLSSLGGEAQGGTALAVDLSEPHAFDLRISLDEVRVDRLLKGVFHSSIADQGRLALGLRLKGQPENVLGITGSGWLRLDEGQLWSIPVVRELFGQLGFDQSAVFDRLRARFQVRGGVIRTSSLTVQSALVNLVGSGKLDLDGSLEYDLEVRYGLLDRLGPLNKLLYWLNNSLWRVAVRGDMDRPRVLIRNSYFEFLRGFREDGRRRLPLPGFAPLPPRF